MAVEKPVLTEEQNDKVVSKVNGLLLKLVGYLEKVAILGVNAILKLFKRDALTANGEDTVKKVLLSVVMLLIGTTQLS